MGEIWGQVIHVIPDGNSFYWSILYLYATGNLINEQSIPDFEKKIKESEKGFLLTWKELSDFLNKLWDLIDITIIACKDKDIIKRYDNDQEMYEKCDIVIEMIDSGYWEIFSKDLKTINQLNKKFKETEILKPDFEK